MDKWKGSWKEEVSQNCLNEMRKKRKRCGGGEIQREKCFQSSQRQGLSSLLLHLTVLFVLILLKLSVPPPPPSPNNSSPGISPQVSNLGTTPVFLFSLMTPLQRLPPRGSTLSHLAFSPSLWVSHNQPTRQWWNESLIWSETWESSLALYASSFYSLKFSSFTLEYLCNLSTGCIGSHLGDGTSILCGLPASSFAFLQPIYQTTDRATSRKPFKWNLLFPCSLWLLNTFKIKPNQLLCTQNLSWRSGSGLHLWPNPLPPLSPQIPFSDHTGITRKASKEAWLFLASWLLEKMLYRSDHSVCPLGLSYILLQDIFLTSKGQVLLWKW